MIIRVHLKTGQTIQFRAEKVSTGRNRATGEIETLKWEGLTGGEEPNAFASDVIAAVTVEQEEAGL